MSTQTNSSLSTARLCLRRYENKYEHQLELAVAEESEALSVGRTWHKALEAEAKGENSFTAIAKHAPSSLWSTKLDCMYAGHQWRWAEDPLNVVEPEHTFWVEWGGQTFGGQVDGIIELDDGRRGIVEYKTTGSAVDDESDYWRGLRLDTQVGIYSLATDADFVVYDVARKPTINPKKLTKKQIEALNLFGRYRVDHLDVDEKLSSPEVEIAIRSERETDILYSLRLMAEIQIRPEFYYNRKPVFRTTADLTALRDDLVEQVAILDRAAEGKFYPRNPDACFAFGRQCEFYALCSRNERVDHYKAEPPDGYVVREHRHPELVKEPDDTEKPST